MPSRRLSTRSHLRYDASLGYNTPALIDALNPVATLEAGTQFSVNMTGSFLTFNLPPRRTSTEVLPSRSKVAQHMAAAREHILLARRASMNPAGHKRARHRDPCLTLVRIPSCQFSLSYDQGKTFAVIASIIGGCPIAEAYTIPIPADVPAGTKALFAWTWQNLSKEASTLYSAAMIADHLLNSWKP